MKKNKKQIINLNSKKIMKIFIKGAFFIFFIVNIVHFALAADSCADFSGSKCGRTHLIRCKNNKWYTYEIYCFDNGTTGVDCGQGGDGFTGSYTQTLPNDDLIATCPSGYECEDGAEFSSSRFNYDSPYNCTESCVPNWVDTSACSASCCGGTKNQRDGCGNTRTVNCNTQDCEALRVRYDGSTHSIGGCPVGSTSPNNMYIRKGTETYQVRTTGGAANSKVYVRINSATRRLQCAKNDCSACDDSTCQ